MEVAELLVEIEFSSKQITYWQAQLFRLLADYAELSEGDEFSDAEIAALLKWKPSFAFNQIAMARELASKLPNTLDAMEKGEIDLYKARVLHDQTLPLTVEQAAEVEERVLEKAAEQTGPQMAQRTRRVVMRVDPEGHAERAAQRKAQRATGIDTMEDDMARLWAFLPADQAVACHLRVSKIARQAKTAGDSRTMDQLRADVVADLLLATPGNESPVKVELHVTVSAATLMGICDQPGELAHYGPITAGLARELSADATWRRLLTDPQTGQALEFGTRTYRPPAALRRLVCARDKTCRHPGCTVPAQRADLDHTVPFPLGPTSPENLGAFCRHHHRLKGKSAWQVTQPKPAMFTFRSPAGRTYHRAPEPVLDELPPF